MSQKGRIELRAVYFSSTTPGVISEITFDVISISEDGNRISRDGYIQLSLSGMVYVIISSPGGVFRTMQSHFSMSLDPALKNERNNNFAPFLDKVKDLGYAVQPYVESSVKPIISMQEYVKLLEE